MSAFADEMIKIAETQSRDQGSPWASKSTGTPRLQMPKSSMSNAPTTPGNLGPKVIKPAAGIGKRQNYSQPTSNAPPETNPGQQAGLRMAPPPNVVFGAK
jgi:hypothetical protein